jgi:hypothetical protein
MKLPNLSAEFLLLGLLISFSLFCYACYQVKRMHDDCLIRSNPNAEYVIELNEENTKGDLK